MILELEYNFTEDEFAAFIDDQALWIVETETANKHYFIERRINVWNYC